MIQQVLNNYYVNFGMSIMKQLLDLANENQLYMSLELGSIFKYGCQPNPRNSHSCSEISSQLSSFIWNLYNVPIFGSGDISGYFSCKIIIHGSFIIILLISILITGLIWVCLSLHLKLSYPNKGQLISEGLFGILNSPKKQTKEFDFTTMIPQVDLFSFVFLEELKTPKSPFEIIWPLLIRPPPTRFSDLPTDLVFSVLLMQRWMMIHTRLGLG